MAPHQSADEHKMASKSSPLGVTKSSTSNAVKAQAHKQRDLQSAMHNAPQVRVIHIFAPKVIKTDVANFKATVQKLTGLSSGRRTKRARTPRASKAAMVIACSAPDGLQTMAQGGASTSATPPPSCAAPSMGYPVGTLWEKEELQRLFGDECDVADLVRCDSVDSASYSFDSGSTGVDTSPTDSFSFYPQRETPYSLDEIPAQFLGHESMHSIFNVNPMVSMPLPLPMMISGSVGALPDQGLLGSLPTAHVADHGMSLLGFEVDSVGAPLPDVLPLGSFGSSSSMSSSSTSGGSLFDLPRHHCRLSVQQPFNQGANFFESM